jgi:membrane carboxypeptidase/penicillin-binding protein PbpC
LKPFIYAAAIDAGRLAPDSTLWDVPIRAGGWEPGNFDGAFLGEMTATDALRQSRNVPAIHVAKATGLGRCVGVLASAGVDLGSQAQRRGGLAIVTGAVEVSLLELTNAYATLGREGVYRPWRLFADAPSPMRRALTTEAAEAVNLMLAQGGQGADLHPNYMAKTGTSSGRRDAWTLGHNGRFAVGVWTGRLRGSGRQEFVGGRCSLPLLDKIMHLDSLRGDFRTRRDLKTAVSRPIKRPSSEPALRIVSPADGQTLQSIAGSSVVHLSATGGEDLQWFLNDNRLAPGAGRVELPPGRHELRCVSAAGRIDRSRVVVLP